MGPDLILTNRHVINDVGSAAGRASFDYALDGAGAERPGSSAPFHGNGAQVGSAVSELDYDVVQLQTAAGEEMLDGGPAKRGWLKPAGHAFATGEPLLILQHPNADRLKVCVGSFAGQSLAPARVRYTANTLPGSSGSPAFTLSWKLVALHQAGENNTNRGIPLDAIVKDLETKGKSSLLTAH